MELYSKNVKRSTRNYFLNVQSTWGETILVDPKVILLYILVLVYNFSGRETIQIIALGQQCTKRSI